MDGDLLLQSPTTPRVGSPGHLCAVAPSVGPSNSGSAQTCLIAFGFKYKQRYMASCRTRVKVCHVFQWWNLENSVFLFLFSFSLILLHKKGRKKCKALKS